MYSVANYFNQFPMKPVDDYGIKTERLGKGAYGVVFKYVKDGNSVAVKKMRNSMSMSDVDSTAIRELSVAALLNHPNIAKILDGYVKPEVIYLVLELGKTDLNTFLSKNKLTSDQITDMFYQMMKGIEYMHSMGVWHRDIKPQNILVFEGNVPKITDFGLARFGALPGNIYTVPIFTVWWRSPDILLGSTKYGPEVDMWAMGLVLSQLAVNGYLITGDKEEDTLKQIITKIGHMNEDSWPGVSGCLLYTSPSPRD